MRSVGLLFGALCFARGFAACVGDDPLPVGSEPIDAGTGDTGSSLADGGSSEATFAFEPAEFDLAPGQKATIKVRGAASLTAVSLALVAEPLPDGGAAPPAITLGASSVSLAPSGEATVDIEAAATAVQQRFRITGRSAGVTSEAKGRVAGKPGELDIFFGDKSGYFDIAPDGDCTARSVIVQPDGKFIVAGNARGYQAMLFARFMPDGQLDTAFGQKGFVTLEQGGGATMESMPDGSIAIGAIVQNNPKLYRLAANGTPDPAWGGAKGVDPGLRGPNFGAGAIARQGDAILVGGGNSDQSNAVIKKYLANGKLDSSFGSGGSVSFPLYSGGGGGTGVSAQGIRVETMRIESGGTIWLAGQYSDSSAGSPSERSWVSRRKSDGSSDGVEVLATYKGAVTGLALQDAKAVVGAFEYPDGLYSLYASRISNTLDSTFGTGGTGRMLVAGPPGGFPTAMATDSDGRIYIANGAYTVNTFDAYRLAANGQRDGTFGQNGLIRLPTGRAYGIAPIGARQLIVVGVNDANDQRRMRIARYWR